MAQVMDSIEGAGCLLFVLWQDLDVSYSIIYLGGFMYLGVY